MMLLSINKNISELMELERKIRTLEIFIHEQQLDVELEVLLQKYFDDFQVG